MRYLVAFLALAVLLPATALGEDFNSTPTTAILYKNGLGWITEEGRGEHESEWVATMLHAVPVVGTMRVVSKGGIVIKEIRSEPGTGDAQMKTVEALQKLAKNHPVQVQALGKTFTGKFLGISYTMTNHEPLLLLEQKEGTILLPATKIEKLVTEVTSKSVPADKKADFPSVRLKLSQKEGLFHLSTSYLTRGLGWTPTYLLDMNAEKNGQLALNAVVVNDTMDLASVELQFATGEAAFPMRWMDSPLFSTATTPEQVMNTVMGNANLGFMNSLDNNPVYNQMNYVPMQQMISADPGMTTPRFSGEETYLYGPAKISLKKGERAIVPLGSGEVPARFVYYWKVPAVVDQANQKNSVWLAAKVMNELPFPLTTGPMLVTKKGKPIGQGFVTYTHQGGEALVPISIASSVLATSGERELDREKSAVNFRGVRYDKVTVKGTLTVENLQKKEVTVRVEKTVNGKVGKTSHKGSKNEQFVSAYNPNPSSTVKWNVKVKAGEKLEIDYHYDYLVERYDKSGW